VVFKKFNDREKWRLCVDQTLQEFAVDGADKFNPSRLRSACQV
jgi:hypothetical protein